MGFEGLNLRTGDSSDAAQLQHRSEEDARGGQVRRMGQATGSESLCHLLAVV